MARACDEAVEKASRAPAIARPWAERTLAELGDGGDTSSATRGDRSRAGPNEKHEAGDGQPRQTIELDLSSAGDDDAADGSDEVVELSSTDPSDRAALNSPPPNSTIKVDGRFTYRTDHLGRVVHASTTLTVVDPKHPRDRTAQRILEGKLDGDHAGHIFARLFQGPGGLTNLVPMLGRKVNQGEHRSLENRWSKSITSDNRHVSVTVTIEYRGDDRRPHSFAVSYKVDGEKRRWRNISNTLAEESHDAR